MASRSLCLCHLSTRSALRSKNFWTISQSADASSTCMIGGAPVGLDIAMRSPDQVAGLIIQNANAHRSGFGPLWEATFEFWANPTAENEAKATSHLTFEFTREQYTGGLPEEVAARIKG